MASTLKRIGLLIVILGLIFISSLFVALVLSLGIGSEMNMLGGNVAVIPINGVISSEKNPWSSTVEPMQVREWIRDAENDPSIKAIVFEINSPGGSAVASDEIGTAIKQTTKPTVAWIREVGASGGYWIASNADHIVANRMSITGSVGVTASYIDFAGTLERYNASYEQLTGGEYKELGTPFKELTPDERKILQSKIDRIHEYFLEEVQTNRNLTNTTMKEIRTGEFFLGIEAYELGLVDELGSFPQVDSYLNATIGEEPIYTHYEKPRSFLADLAELRSNFLPGMEETTVIRT